MLARAMLETLGMWLEKNPLIGLVLILLVAIGWLAKQWVKSIQTNTDLAVRFAAATEATNRATDLLNERLKAIEGKLG